MIDKKKCQKCLYKLTLCGDSNCCGHLYFTGKSRMLIDKGEECTVYKPLKGNIKERKRMLRDVCSDGIKPLSEEVMK